MSIAVKELNNDLIHRANSNSFGGKRGDISEYEYQVYVERVLSWPISEEKSNPSWINCMRNGVKC